MFSKEAKIKSKRGRKALDPEKDLKWDLE